ncbi:MrcB family domain-containing protein [Vagococcus fluvialis]|uniref:MrcB family domain-containing protein n=1 Tax=Vagococcus fluvialis TaxID=2738 RepID=UPI003D0F52DC
MNLSALIETIAKQYPLERAKGSSAFTGSEVGDMVKNQVPKKLEELLIADDYYIKGSIGNGQFASIPWIAIMNKKITKSTTKGIYIVFLFSEDGEKVYLTLNQGVTYFDEKRYDRLLVKKASKKIYESLQNPESQPVMIELNSSTKLGQGYEKTTISGYEYSVNDIPSESRIVSDLGNLIKDYKQLIDLYIEKGEEIDAFYESILGDFVEDEKKYIQFKYLFKRFVEQSQINITDKLNRKPTLSSEGFEEKQFSRVSDYDSVTIDKIDYHIHLFNSGQYGRSNGEGTGKVPYIDYQVSDKKWANIRTSFSNFEMKSVRFTLWNEIERNEKEIGKNYSISEMDLFSEESPNLYFIKFYNDYINLRKEENKMITNSIVNDLSKKLIESKNIILRGAPGTGKSYLAKEIAAQLIGTSKERLDESDRFEFVQFHPSYDYTDFVEGLRPIVSEDGSMGFELQSGVFKSFCQSAINAQEYGGQDNFEESYDSYLNYINSSEEKEYLTRSCFVSINSKNNLKVSYDSGTEGGVIPKLYLYELYKDENYNEQNYYRSNGLTVLERLKEKFGLLDYDKPNLNKKDVTKKFVFVIDEINRGEISKIFGELFYSIDPGYRGQLGAVKTQYSNMSSSNEKFYIPENVYIIGTMNDIDRSVDSFDFAMRRRFRFIEIKANESTDMLNGLENKEEAIVRMVCLNNAISEVEELNDNYHIGASYFLKLDSLTFEELWCDYLEPLLADYIRGMFNEEEIMKSFKKAYNSNFSKTGDMNDDSQNQG